MIKFRNNLDPQFKWIILWWVIWIVPGLLITWYTWNRNRKQQKYFKLQQVWEEIINAILKWQNTYILYEIKKENIIFIKDILTQELDLNRWNIQPNISEKSLEIYNKSSEKLDKLWEMKQSFYNTIFSKIQVYFSESWLSKVRDQSVSLSNLIAELYLEKDENKKEEIEEKITNLCNKIKNTIIIKIMRYGRPFYKNFRYHRTNKYENK